jgi:DNA mismatch repair protein MutS
MTVTRPSQEGAAATPMMAQYLAIKAAHLDCLLFYRMGDFYELFFADAEIASAALGIVLTKRGKHSGADIPMCGVPIDRADDYLRRLIQLGHRVAVCEQTEDPAEAKKRGAKSVVRRAVVRLVTPGTITEEQLLEPARANVLVAVAPLCGSDGQPVFGLAAVDISTGAFTVSETAESGLASEISRLDPSELIVPERSLAQPKLNRILTRSRASVTPVSEQMSEAVGAERRLCAFFAVATVAGLGPLSRAEVAAAGCVLAYIERTQLGARPELAAPLRLGRGQILEIDAATRSNLELTRTLAGGRDGSLLATIDMTVTASGGRLLAERLSAPLAASDLINQRLDAVDYFIADAILREDVRALLKQTPDLARALQRLALDRGGPRDLAAIRRGLEVADQVAARLRHKGVPARSAIGEAMAALERPDPALLSALAEALADDLPAHRRDGGFVRATADPALDEARLLRDDSRRVIAALQNNYSERTRTRQLKIKHNHFLGYFIEVPQAAGENLLRPPFADMFIHRQTMADAMRFSTLELNALEAKIAAAQEQAVALENAIFERLRRRALADLAAIRAATDALAVVDVAAALAELAATRDWARPTVDESLAFAVDRGRHPVVEAALKQRGTAFVANDCELSPSADGFGQIALITGPNMAGKSTYLRQNALIVILAQMGSFVPVVCAHLGVVDRLFSRVGAADDLARGQSTFMVEMVETAAILNQATAHSLIILDEIGRGTATFDGLSIAWASIEHLHASNRARTLFATHFHELTQLAKTLPRLLNLTVRVTEWKDEPIFLHEVIRGAADRSYGIQVAKLAGLPASVIKRARRILAMLEAGERRGVGRGLDDLPLFAVATAAPPEPVAPHPIHQAIAALNPDDMSPREALQALYELKRISAREPGDGRT